MSESIKANIEQRFSRFPHYNEENIQEENNHNIENLQHTQDQQEQDKSTNKQQVQRPQKVHRVKSITKSTKLPSSVQISPQNTLQQTHKSQSHDDTIAGNIQKIDNRIQNNNVQGIQQENAKLNPKQRQNTSTIQKSQLQDQDLQTTQLNDTKQRQSQIKKQSPQNFEINGNSTQAATYHDIIQHKQGNLAKQSDQVMRATINDATHSRTDRLMSPIKQFNDDQQGANNQGNKLEDRVPDWKSFIQINDGRVLQRYISFQKIKEQTQKCQTKINNPFLNCQSQNLSNTQFITKNQKRQSFNVTQNVNSIINFGSGFQDSYVQQLRHSLKFSQQAFEDHRQKTQFYEVIDQFFEQNPYANSRLLDFDIGIRLTKYIVEYLERLQQVSNFQSLKQENSIYYGQNPPKIQNIDTNQLPAKRQLENCVNFKYNPCKCSRQELQIQDQNKLIDKNNIYQLLNDTQQFNQVALTKSLCRNILLDYISKSKIKQQKDKSFYRQKHHIAFKSKQINNLLWDTANKVVSLLRRNEGRLRSRKSLRSSDPQLCVIIYSPFGQSILSLKASLILKTYVQRIISMGQDTQLDFLLHNNILPQDVKPQVKVDDILQNRKDAFNSQDINQQYTEQRLAQQIAPQNDKKIKHNSQKPDQQQNFRTNGFKQDNDYKMTESNTLSANNFWKSKVKINSKKGVLTQTLSNYSGNKIITNQVGQSQQKATKNQYQPYLSNPTFKHNTDPMNQMYRNQQYYSTPQNGKAKFQGYRNAPKNTRPDSHQVLNKFQDQQYISSNVEPHTPIYRNTDLQSPVKSNYNKNPIIQTQNTPNCSPSPLKRKILFKKNTHKAIQQVQIRNLQSHQDNLQGSILRSGDQIHHLTQESMLQFIQNAYPSHLQQKWASGKQLNFIKGRIQDIQQMLNGESHKDKCNKDVQSQNKQQIISNQDMTNKVNESCFLVTQDRNLLGGSTYSEKYLSSLAFKIYTCPQNSYQQPDSHKIQKIQEKQEITQQIQNAGNLKQQYQSSSHSIMTCPFKLETANLKKQFQNAIPIKIDNDIKQNQNQYVLGDLLRDEDFSQDDVKLKRNDNFIKEAATPLHQQSWELLYNKAFTNDNDSNKQFVENQNLTRQYQQVKQDCITKVQPQHQNQLLLNKLKANVIKQEKDKFEKDMQRIKQQYNLIDKQQSNAIQQSNGRNAQIDQLEYNNHKNDNGTNKHNQKLNDQNVPKLGRQENYNQFQEQISKETKNDCNGGSKDKQDNQTSDFQQGQNLNHSIFQCGLYIDVSYKVGNEQGMAQQSQDIKQKQNQGNTLLRKKTKLNPNLDTQSLADQTIQEDKHQNWRYLYSPLKQQVQQHDKNSYNGNIKSNQCNYHNLDCITQQDNNNGRQEQAQCQQLKQGAYDSQIQQQQQNNTGQQQRKRMTITNSRKRNKANQIQQYYQFNIRVGACWSDQNGQFYQTKLFESTSNLQQNYNVNTLFKKPCLPLKRNNSILFQAISKDNIDTQNQTQGKARKISQQDLIINSRLQDFDTPYTGTIKGQENIKQYMKVNQQNKQQNQDQENLQILQDEDHEKKEFQNGLYKQNCEQSLDMSIESISAEIVQATIQAYNKYHSKLNRHPAMYQTQKYDDKESKTSNLPTNQLQNQSSRQNTEIPIENLVFSYILKIHYDQYQERDQAEFQASLVLERQEVGAKFTQAILQGITLQKSKATFPHSIKAATITSFQQCNQQQQQQVLNSDVCNQQNFKENTKQEDQKTQGSQRKVNLNTIFVPDIVQVILSSMSKNQQLSGLFDQYEVYSSCGYGYNIKNYLVYEAGNNKNFSRGYKSLDSANNSLHGLDLQLQGYVDLQLQKLFIAKNQSILTQPNKKDTDLYQRIQGDILKFNSDLEFVQDQISKFKGLYFNQIEQQENNNNDHLKRQVGDNINQLSKQSIQKQYNDSSVVNTYTNQKQSNDIIDGQVRKIQGPTQSIQNTIHTTQNQPQIQNSYDQRTSQIISEQSKIQNLQPFQGSIQQSVTSNNKIQIIVKPKNEILQSQNPIHITVKPEGSVQQQTQNEIIQRQTSVRQGQKQQNQQLESINHYNQNLQMQPVIDTGSQPVNKEFQQEFIQSQPQDKEQEYCVKDQINLPPKPQYQVYGFRQHEAINQNQQPDKQYSDKLPINKSQTQLQYYQGTSKLVNEENIIQYYQKLLDDCKSNNQDIELFCEGLINNVSALSQGLNHQICLNHVFCDIFKDEINQKQQYCSSNLPYHLLLAIKALFNYKQLNLAI